MRMHAFIASLILAVAATASAQAPGPVAERSFTRRGETTRVSLFNNGALVVTMSKDGVQNFMRQITLPEDQYLVYLGSFVTNSTELKENPVNSDVGTSSAEVVVVIHVGPNAPRQFRFSPMASVSLPFSRILGALDDLQNQAMNASQSAEEMRLWEPKRRDRVQLFNGGYAVVREVWDDGMIVIEYESTYIREMVTPGNRDKVILRVVGPEE